MSIATLRERIARLPADPLYVFHIYNNQQGHWDLWLSDYLTAGSYGRTVIKDDARYCYNHVVNPQLLVYLGWASGVDRAIQKRAEAAVSSSWIDCMPRASGAYRRIVTWEMIYDRLWPTAAEGQTTGAPRVDERGGIQPLVTAAQLAEAIKGLPADFRRATARDEYASRKDHWLAWLDAYRGVGCYAGKIPRDDAAYVYNNIDEHELLAYLAWACDVPKDLRKQAVAKMEDPRGAWTESMSVKFRKVVRWELIRDHLWPELGPKRLPPVAFVITNPAVGFHARSSAAARKRSGR